MYDLVISSLVRISYRTTGRSPVSRAFGGPMAYRMAIGQRQRNDGLQNDGQTLTPAKAAKKKAYARE